MLGCRDSPTAVGTPTVRARPRHPPRLVPRPRLTLDTGATDLQAVAALKSAREKILTELRKVIVGQDQVVEQLLTALFANGHVLLVGVPGLAKTLLVSSLARVLDLKFNRIQFTPDLMPSDITGTDVLEESAAGKREIRFIAGPVFANIVLADEINRTPPKTQAALLQAMQEKQVTAGGQTFDLALPFFVLATQNPIELEGTYPLPEAQLDRFMFNVRVDYPSQAEEEEIVASTTSAYEARLERVLGAADILALQKLIRRVPVAEHVVRYAVRLARATRAGAGERDAGTATGDGAANVGRWVSWGAGPRASQYLVLGAKTRAVLHGRFAPGIEDVKAVAPAVLRHRIVTNFTAEAEGIKPERIIEELLKSVPSE
ncbi:MAG: MoxR family ATPase [Candidatus Eisenbacteria bacterium]|uniref:MoxR family ATPase n=1 Tax=Eiseniibacteriota bacterium TaxID=2212470 RepID=A0A9D6L6F0_UNCEI|nr:MoxR family ATPase [Candidatus Eisenbacteria bacterium]MBI3539773.1 MoxR family ATPase [Candidatus Eisenbacteria bacterium]